MMFCRPPIILWLKSIVKENKSVSIVSQLFRFRHQSVTDTQGMFYRSSVTKLAYTVSCLLKKTLRLLQSHVVTQRWHLMGCFDTVP